MVFVDPDGRENKQASLMYAHALFSKRTGLSSEDSRYDEMFYKSDEYMLYRSAYTDSNPMQDIPMVLDWNLDDLLSLGTTKVGKIGAFFIFSGIKKISKNVVKESSLEVLERGSRDLFERNTRDSIELANRKRSILRDLEFKDIKKMENQMRSVKRQGAAEKIFKKKGFKIIKGDHSKVLDPGTGQVVTVIPSSPSTRSGYADCMNSLKSIWRKFHQEN
jgi:hypothetical protein